MYSLENHSAWAASFDLMSLSAFLDRFKGGTYVNVAEGRLQIVPWGKKVQRFVVFCTSASTSIRYSVAIPEHLVLADSVTRIHKSGNTFLRINVIKRRAKPGATRVLMYPDPKTGAQLPFESSLLYKKRGRNWVLVGVDGRQID